MTDQVRTAAVGLGYWGPNLVRNLHEIDCSSLVTVCDARPDRLETIARRYPAVRATTSYEEILADPCIDAVAIATPVSTHFDLAAAAIRAGKHVFVEKPFAHSVAAATELVELAEEHGVVVMPGHTFLYSPPVLLIKDLIDAGELGDIYFISMSRVNLGLHQQDVSVVWDLGPHDFSMLRYWLDATPSHVAATSRSCILPNIPDIAFVNLEYPEPHPAIGHVEFSWLAPSKLRRTTIVGSEKMVVYDDTSNEPVRVFDSGVMLKDPESFGEYRLTYRTGDIVSPQIPVSEPLAVELRDFCSAIVDGTTPRSSHEVGVDVLRVIEAVDQSLALDGARIALPEPSVV